MGRSLTYESFLCAGRDRFVRGVVGLAVRSLRISGSAFDGAVSALVGVRQRAGGCPGLSGVTKLRAAVLHQARHLGDRPA